MRLLMICLLLMLPFGLAATSVVPRALPELVADADTIVVATIREVDMIDKHGKAIRDRAARTGPGTTDRMRFHLQVEEVIAPRGKTLPTTLVVPLWSMWHYELGTMQDQVTGSRGIFLLKGEHFEPVYPAFFQRPLDERGEIEALLAAGAN